EVVGSEDEDTGDVDQFVEDVEDARNDIGREVVAGVDDEVGLEAGQRLGPGGAMPLPGSQVRVGDAEDPDGCGTGRQDRKGVSAGGEEVRLDDRAPDAGGRGCGEATGEECTLVHSPNSTRSRSCAC